MLAQRAEPTQQMGIAAQLGKLAHAGERGMEIGKETTSNLAIVSQGVGTERGG